MTADCAEDETMMTTADRAAAVMTAMTIAGGRSAAEDGATTIGARAGAETTMMMSVRSVAAVAGMMTRIGTDEERRQSRWI
jgi:hypothetical protein